MAQKRLTPNQKQFEKEVKRLNRLINISKKSGIVFIESPIPEKPKRITYKRLKQIHDITLSDLQSKGYIVNDVGEFQPFVPQKKSRKKKALPPPKPRKSSAYIKFPKASASDISESKPTETFEEPEIKPKETAPKETFEEPEAKPIETFEEPDPLKDFTKLPDDFEFPANDWEVAIDNLRNLLESANNANISAYLTDLLQNEIDDAEFFAEDDETGEEIVGRRLLKANERLIELATVIQNEDSSGEKLRYAAYNIAVLITGNNVTPTQKEDIERYAYEDIPYRPKTY